MNSGARGASAAGGFAGIRLAIAMLLAIPVWLLLLAGMARWLQISTSTRASEKPLEIRLVELDMSPAPSLVAPAAPAEPTKAAAPAAPVEPAAARSAHAPRPRAPDMPPVSKQPAQHKLEPRSATHDIPAPSAPESTQSKTAGVASVRSPSADDAGAASASSADFAARSIAQPLPELPDDLREQSYETAAMARFLIHVDGSVDVELIKPTPIPRLNQILLDTLRKWRFIPAMQGGHPVESKQDIRIRFNVR